MAPVPTPEILWRKPPVLAVAALPGRALGRLEEPSTFDLATLTLAHEENLDDVLAGYGADVDRDLNHITHTDTRQGVQQLYDKAEVTAEDVAEIIAFILSRPRRLAVNEILRRPAGQE